MVNNAKFARKYQFETPKESSSLSSGTEKSAKTASYEAVLVLKNQNGVKNGVSFKNYRSLCMAARKQKMFKDPKIVKCKNGDWYVGYYFRDPENPAKWYKDEFKERCGINYIKDAGEKEKEFEVLRLDVLNWLLAGNSPFDKEKRLEEKIIAAEEQVRKKKIGIAIWSLSTAIEKYDSYIEANKRNEEKLDGYSKNTIRSYKKYTRVFNNWLTENELGGNPAYEFNEFELEEFLNDLAEIKDWKGRTYNNYLEFFGGFFSKTAFLENRIRAKQKILKLPYQLSIEGIEHRIVTMQRNKPFTPQMVIKLKEAMDTAPRKNLREYCEWISMSMMRPDEIRHLKVENIDMGARQIRIIGKTGERLIPVSDQLSDLIKRRNVQGAPPNAYVFGYAGVLDERRMSVAYFLEQFAEVRTEIGLGPEFGPYNFKHTYAQGMRIAGFAEEEIMVMTGHKTIEAFRAYMAGFHIDHSHVMKGSVIDF